MPNFGVALPPSDPYGSKENQYLNGGHSTTPTVPGVLFPGKIANAEGNHSSFGGSSFSSRPGFSSSFRDHADEAASPAPIRSGELLRNPLLTKTPTLSNGTVTPRKVSFGAVISQNNSFKLQGSIAAESSANTSFAPEASPLGLSRSNYSLLARNSMDNQNTTLTPMSVENGPSESLVTGAHSPAVTFFGVEEDYLSHSTSYMPQTPGSYAPHTPGKSLLNCSVVSHLQSQDPWVILSHELSNLAYWKDPLFSAAVFSACSTLLVLTRVLALSTVSVTSSAVIITVLLGCMLQGLQKSLGLSSPVLQRISSLPLFQIDAWETATLALVACSFRGTETFFVHLRQAHSGQDLRQTCAALLLLWTGSTFGSHLDVGISLSLLLLFFFAGPLSWDYLSPRIEHAKELFSQLKAPAQTALLALWALTASVLFSALARWVVLSLSALDFAGLGVTALAALLIAANAEGKNPGRVLVSALVTGGKGMGPAALKVLRAIQSPLKDGLRKQ